MSEEDVIIFMTERAREVLDIVSYTRSVISIGIGVGNDPLMYDKAMRDVVRNSEFTSSDSDLIAKFFDAVARGVKIH